MWRSHLRGSAFVNEVWGHESPDFHDKTINVAIIWLKKKLYPEGCKHYFEPVWGVGCKLT